MSYKLKKLEKRIEHFVNQGVKRGMDEKDVHRFATIKSNLWIDMHAPELAHMKSEVE